MDEQEGKCVVAELAATDPTDSAAADPHPQHQQQGQNPTVKLQVGLQQPGIVQTKPGGVVGEGHGQEINTTHDQESAKSGNLG